MYVCMYVCMYLPALLRRYSAGGIEEGHPQRRRVGLDAQGGRARVPPTPLVRVHTITQEARPRPEL